MIRLYFVADNNQTLTIVLFAEHVLTHSSIVSILAGDATVQDAVCF